MRKSFSERTSYTLHSTLFSYLLPLFLFLLPLSVFGAEGVKYDGLYDRPTHFPTFTQPTAWAGTMSYFVYVHDTSGRPLTNYEVAVYDQDGLLRHVSRSISSQDELCTLTIPGQGGHTFTFKVIYGDFASPTIVDAEETVQFKANAIVGGPFNPFWLTIPVPVIPGDVNGDGEVSIVDVAELVSLLIAHPEGSPTIGTGEGEAPAAADVNGDTHVDLADVIALRQLILQIN